ncbi:MAG: hypothetical protein WDN26_19925 [Chitinophagaceae bacterium]
MRAQAHPAHGSQTFQQECHYLHDQPGIESSFFEDVADDDEINDAERKKYSPLRSDYSNVSFAEHILAGNHLKRITSPGFFIHPQPPLYLFTRVFRL